MPRNRIRMADKRNLAISRIVQEFYNGRQRRNLKKGLNDL